MIKSSSLTIRLEIRLDRIKHLQNWLTSIYSKDTFELSPASSDASFRRYFRVCFTNRPQKTLIVMDAPPEREDSRTFVKIAKLFAEAKVHVPAILVENFEQGFLLLSDLGDTTYLKALNEDNADQLYRAAIDALIKIQQISRPQVLPDYDSALLEREMRLFPDWYLSKHLQLTLSQDQQRIIQDTFSTLLANNLAQVKVFVHRDYHSRNLMLSDPNPGILDFQDAVYGPITYDMVSLLKDAYISWKEEQALDWLIRYWEQAKKGRLPVPRDFAEFHRDYEWMGIQRHLKVLGIFARLYHRDGKDGYLKDLPLVMSHLRQACERYREFKPLVKLLDEIENRSTTVKYTF